MGGLSIITATATGELHALKVSTLESESGFPLRLDSVSAQVAVADLFQNGALELVVGDNSGNIYCVDAFGKTLWEFETKETIYGSVRFVDLDGDSSLDVVLVTTRGCVWVLHGMSGTPFPGFPIHLNTHVPSSSFVIMHLSHSGQPKAPTAIIPSITSLLVVDLVAKCVDSVAQEDHNVVLLATQSGDIDPYHPGIEILVMDLEGKLMCFGAGSQGMSDYEMVAESWEEEALSQNVFTHKNNSFLVLIPQLNKALRDISGSSFRLEIQIYDNAARRSKEFTVKVSIGQKYHLYNNSLPVYQRKTTHTLLVPTPSEPIASFLTITVCNEFLQCNSVFHHAKFNLHFQDTLQWFLALPFLALTSALLWLLRDADFEPLPGAGFSSTSRKNL